MALSRWSSQESRSAGPGCSPGRRWPGRRSLAGLRLHPEYAGSIAAENSHLLFIAQGGCGHDRVHRVLLPRIRVVAAEHDLARANLGRQMAQGLRCEYQRVEVEL